MKKLLFSICALIYFFNSLGQSIQAGMVTEKDVYLELGPIYTMEHTLGNIMEERKTIDIDQNSTGEILFIVHGGRSNTGDRFHTICEVLPMINLVKIATRKDTSISNIGEEIVMDVPILFEEGDVIDESYDYVLNSAFIWSASIGDISLPNIDDFSNVGSFYIGFTIEIYPFYYGWINVEISQDTTTRKINILDAAYNSFTSNIHTISDNIKVFPNPFNNILHIELENPKINTKITISDILGKQYLNEPINNSHTLDLSHLSKGIYFIQATSGDKKITKRIIKK